MKLFLTCCVSVVCGVCGFGAAAENLPATTAAITANVRSDRFAVNVHMLRDTGGPPAQMPLIARGGFTLFRTGEEWKNVEKARGVYSTTPAMDKAIDQAKSMGLEPLYVLAYENKLYDNSIDPERFADHALWLMDHYKGKVKYWELWNEPQNFFFRTKYGGTWNGREANGSESPWVGKFAEFITIVSAKLKAKHPEMVLVTGSASVVDMRLLRDHAAMWEHIDVLAIHPYPYRLPPELQPFGGPKMLARDGVAIAGPDHSFESMIGLYREAIAKSGHPNMPIWVTEVGYPTSFSYKPSMLWAGMTEPAQAAYLARFGILSTALGVEKTFFYCLVDSGNDNGEVEHRFGLLRRDLKPKPSYLALQRLAGLMPGETEPVSVAVRVDRLAPQARTDSTTWDAETITLLDRPEVHCFKRPDGKWVLFFWRAGRIYADLNDELCTLTLPAPLAGLKVQAMGHVVSGDAVEIKTSQGKEPGTLSLQNVPLSSDPLYVVLQ